MSTLRQQEALCSTPNFVRFGPIDVSLACFVNRNRSSESHEQEGRSANAEDAARNIVCVSTNPKEKQESLAKELRDIDSILPLTRNPIVSRRSARGGQQIMKPRKLKKKIDQLEKRLREGSQKLAVLKRKLQQAETAKALKAARKSAARTSANRPAPAAAKKPKKKLNLSPERRAQLAAAMKARWAAKRAAEGGAISTDKNSPTPPTQPPENRADGV